MQSKALINSTEIKKNQTQLISILIACTLLVILGIGFCLQIDFFKRNHAVVELQTRINPNTAPVCSLMRLPQIGRGRASAIVDYRMNHDSEKPFEICGDLQKVKGIGPVISGQLCDYLRFE